MFQRNAIMLGLQYRDRLSVGENRQRLGYGAFHWSILVKLDSGLHRFDVTDGIVQDPVTFENLNPDQDWVYRHLTGTTEADIPRYLGAVNVGRITSPRDLSQLEWLLQHIPLPEKGRRPHQNCVSWAVEAVGVLQNHGFCSPFEIDTFKAFVLHHADERIAHFNSVPAVIDYPAANLAKGGWLRSVISKFR